MTGSCEHRPSPLCHARHPISLPGMCWFLSRVRDQP